MTESGYMDMTPRFCNLCKKLKESRISFVIDEKICVEGVEKSEWSRRLRNLNVDYLQGYLYGKPCEKSTDVVARWGVIK